ncbi:MFS transporter [Candidatus Blastococcus massiliensis]|uniref:MFS transporter n=1 Tax=Candidatus Blastococcus massiliensis TaxID=1470358 RepID=UPI0004B401A8|nr:MFS transporter [Candidatus Blastococcus massiliensis]
MSDGPDPDEPAEPPEVLDPRRRRWVLVACLAGMFATTFPATILTIAVQPIALDLDSAPSTVLWVTTAPLLAAAVSTPLLGRLGDIRGHRRLFLTGMVVAGLFAVATALAWNAGSLITARTVSQLGAAATVPSSFAMLFRAHPPAQRVRVSSLASATLAGAAVIGVVIGGPLVDLVGWRIIFAVQAAVCAAALLAALPVLPADPRDRVRVPLDLPGALALAVLTLSVTFGINRLGVWGWAPLPLACLAVAPFALWALVRIERRSASPLLPIRVLSSRNTRVVTVASFLLGAGWMGNFVLTPLLMQSVMGLSAGLTSLLSVPRATFIVAAAPTASRWGQRFGERRMVVVASAGLALVMGSMSIGAAATSVVAIAIALPLSGWAFGHAQPGLLSAMGHAVDERDFGLATSLQQTAMQIGSVVGIGLFTAVAGDATTPGPFVLVYLLTAACVLAAVPVALLMRDGHSRPR